MWPLFMMWVLYAIASGAAIGVTLPSYLAGGKFFAKPTPRMHLYVLRLNGAVFGLAQLLFLATVGIVIAISDSKLDRDIAQSLVITTIAFGLLAIGLIVISVCWRKLDWPMWLNFICAGATVSALAFVWILVIRVALAIASIPQF